MHKRRRQRNRLQRARFASAAWSPMVVEIDCLVHGGQLAGLLLRPASGALRSRLP